MPKINVSIDPSQATAGATRVVTALRSISSAGMSLLSSVFSPLNTAIAGIGTGLAVGGLIKTADAYKTMGGQLKFVTGNANDAAFAQKDLYEMSQKTGTSMTENANSFVRLMQAQEMTGLSGAENIKVLGALNAIMIKTGTSSSAASNAMYQLSQALVSGQLNGDEFKSMAENAPGVLLALSKAIGVPRSELKKMAADGKLTSDILGKAFLQMASDGTATFNDLPKTVESGWQRVVNAFEAAWARIDKETGITDAIFDSLLQLASWLEQNSGMLSGWVFALVEAVKNNWPTVQTAIDNLINSLDTMFTNTSDKGPTLQSTMAGIAEATAWVIDGMSSLIGIIDRVTASWDALSASAQTAMNYVNMLPPMAMARAAGTLAGGGSIGEAWDAFKDNENQMITPTAPSSGAPQAIEKRATNRQPGTAQQNLYFNGQYSRSDVVNISLDLTRQGARL